VGRNTVEEGKMEYLFKRKEERWESRGKGGNGVKRPRKIGRRGKNIKLNGRREGKEEKKMKEREGENEKRKEVKRKTKEEQNEGRGKRKKEEEE
jgi:hypothetical protein